MWPHCGCAPPLWTGPQSVPPSVDSRLDSVTGGGSIGARIRIALEHGSGFAPIDTVVVGGKTPFRFAIRIRLH